MRATLAKLDTIDTDSAVNSLTAEDVTLLRRQLAEGQNLVRETLDRLRLSQEENELLTRRRDEVESRLTALEGEYEELLGAVMPCFVIQDIDHFQIKLFTTKKRTMSIS